MSKQLYTLTHINSIACPLDGHDEFGICANSHKFELDHEGKIYQVTFITEYFDHRELSQAVRNELPVDEAISNAYYTYGEIEIYDEDDNVISGDEHQDLSNLLYGEYQNYVDSDRDAQETQYYYELTQGDRNTVEDTGE